MEPCPWGAEVGYLALIRPTPAFLQGQPLRFLWETTLPLLLPKAQVELAWTLAAVGLEPRLVRVSD